MARACYRPYDPPKLYDLPKLYDVPKLDDLPVMTRPIGYYVHHQGRGHFDRALLIARAMRRRCTLIGTLPDDCPSDMPALRLPDDAPIGAAGSTHEDMPRALHYAPLNFGPVRARMSQVAAWIASHNPALIVVDVSVEIAMFCRLLSVPIIVVRLTGDRSDTAHLEAFRTTQHIIAPFPKPFEHVATPDWVREKSSYPGFIQAAPTPQVDGVVPGTVGVVLGSGGAALEMAHLVAAADATPERAWHVFGRTGGRAGAQPRNLTCHGFVHEIDAAVARMEILVSAAGDGVVSLAVRQGKRYVCLPEARPYDEQGAKARVLAASGAAVVRQSWPHANEWPAVLDEAMRLDIQAIMALRNERSLLDAVAIIEETASLYDG